MTERVGVALLGVGRWGRQLARAFDARGELALGWTRSDETNAAYFRNHHPRAEHTTDLDRALGDPSVGAVAIATPMTTHAALAEAALRAGKHVFVEKPMSTDPESGRALVALADVCRRSLFVGHVFLYHPVFQRLLELTHHRRVTYLGTSWRKLGTFDSDLLWNLAPHEVALALALFGRRPTDAAVVHRRGLVTACDEMIIQLAFDESACVMSLNRCAPEAPQKTLTVSLEGGETLVWHGQTLTRLERDGTPSVLFEAREAALDREVSAFLGACRGEGPILSNGAQGLAVVEILTALASGGSPA